jgi:hypothetical protein
MNRKSIIPSNLCSCLWKRKKKLAEISSVRKGRLIIIITCVTFTHFIFKKKLSPKNKMQAGEKKRN